MAHYTDKLSPVRFGPVRFEEGIEPTRKRNLGISIPGSGLIRASVIDGSIQCVCVPFGQLFESGRIVAQSRSEVGLIYFRRIVPLRGDVLWNG